jgi:hypothetical protein
MWGALWQQQKFLSQVLLVGNLSAVWSTCCYVHAMAFGVAYFLDDLCMEVA